MSREKSSRFRRTSSAKVARPSRQLMKVGRAACSFRRSSVTDDRVASARRAAIAEVPAFWFPSTITGCGFTRANGDQAARTPRRGTERNRRGGAPGPKPPPPAGGGGGGGGGTPPPGV